MKRKLKYIFKDILAAFIYPSFLYKKPKYYLALCCIVKDENTYLEEWIQYHQKIGVEHFYIYDNDSRIPVKETLAHLPATLVTVISFGGPAAQLPAYQACLDAHGKEAQWIGFIDTDEFVVPKTTTQLPQLLKQYEAFGGLGINWIVFGSSGHKTRPQGLQTQNFLLHSAAQTDINRHIKSIVQPRYVKSAGNDPHHFSYKPLKYAVNPLKAKVKDPRMPNETTIVQLNHYYLRSEEEFRAKINRGFADQAGRRTMDDFYQTDALCTLKSDTAIIRLL